MPKCRMSKVRAVMTGLLALVMLLFVASPASAFSAATGMAPHSVSLVRAAAMHGMGCADGTADPSKGDADHHGVASGLCVACVGISGLHAPAFVLSTPCASSPVIHFLPPREPPAGVEATPALPPPRSFV